MRPSIRMLSTDIISFLDWLRDRGRTFDLERLKGALGEIYLNDVDPDAIREDQEIADFFKEMEGMAGKIALSKLRPLTDSKKDLQELIQQISKVSELDFIDYYFTAKALRSVSDKVRRWKKVGEAFIDQRPDERVRDYYWEAAICFVYGFFNAVAVLSRAVLDFALKHAVAIQAPAIPPPTKLEDLIDYAGHRHILTPELIPRAHNIRKNGNKAIHQAKVCEETAQSTLTDTLQILQHIYKAVP